MTTSGVVCESDGHDARMRPQTLKTSVNKVVLMYKHTGPPNGIVPTTSVMATSVMYTLPNPSPQLTMIPVDVKSRTSRAPMCKVFGHEGDSASGLMRFLQRVLPSTLCRFDDTPAL